MLPAYSSSLILRLIVGSDIMLAERLTKLLLEIACGIAKSVDHIMPQQLIHFIALYIFWRHTDSLDLSKVLLFPLHVSGFLSLSWVGVGFSIRTLSQTCSFYTESNETLRRQC